MGLTIIVQFNTLHNASMRRARLLAGRLAILIGLFSCIWLISGPRKLHGLSSKQRRVLLRRVDTTLDNYVSNLLPTGSLGRRGNISDLTRIFLVQITSDCMRSRAKWRVDNPDSSSSPILALGEGCLRTKPSRSAGEYTNRSLEICSVLSGKKVLFVGPETTYYLHDLWLRSLGVHENRAHFCPGQDYCTFHHICKAPADEGEENADEIVERKKKTPGNSMLMATKSALLQYVLSTTLHTSKDMNGEAYSLPVIDVETNVRMPNNYWLRKARKAEIVVMNRGPLPAPASTYSFSNAFGNWTFTDLLCKKRNRLGSHCFRSLEDGLVNAALSATLDVFLPRLLDSLETIMEGPGIHNSHHVWQGSWYLQVYCAQAHLPTAVPLLPAILSHDRDAGWVDPWTFYYNSQVYMHDYVLPKLLPYFNVTYLPLTFPMFDGFRNRTGPKFTKTSSEIRPKDCMRNPWPTFGKDGLEVAFFSMLSMIISPR